MADDAQEKIQRLTLIEQNMQQILQQKQQLQAQQFEIDSAQKEMTDTPAAYKIIGNIMVRKDTDTLKKDLSERKELLDLRLKSIEKQESALKDKAQTLQQEVLGALKGAKKE